MGVRVEMYQVYPRVCGGTHSVKVAVYPRVCGGTLSVLRSIPACAGEPRLLTARGPMLRVYPRVCGGTDRAARST